MSAAHRTPLSRERVLKAAVRLADEAGIEALTMRRLAEDLGAEAMSLYYHVRKKDDVLDGVVDMVSAEINESVDRLEPRPDWKAAVRERILAARQVFLRHPWAPPVFESRRSASPMMLRYYDGLVALMRAGGFSNDLVHHSLHALGSRAIGFSQELFAPTSDTTAADIPPEMAAHLPHLAGMLLEVAHNDPDSTLGWCDDQTEFEFGLDVILDGLDRLRVR